MTTHTFPFETNITDFISSFAIKSQIFLRSYILIPGSLIWNFKQILRSVIKLYLNCQFRVIHAKSQSFATHHKKHLVVFGESDADHRNSHL